MTIIALVLIGIFTGLTTVLFGFGGGFITVPVMMWVGSASGSASSTVAVATSAVVMVVNAAIATAATPRRQLTRLGHRASLLGMLAAGGLLGAITALHVPSQVSAWGFVIYLAVTIIDTLTRPGFVRPARTTPDITSCVAIPSVLGAPIGAVASLLGVGGSVMTVPLLRRSGMPMNQAATLANPLTLAISLPASIVFLMARTTSDVRHALVGVGIVDVGAAALLLVGALPVIVAFRRHPARIADRPHAWSYLVLLVVALAVGTVPLFTWAK